MLTEILSIILLYLFKYFFKYNPFVLACGDATGYGLHADFLNGWDQTVLQVFYPSSNYLIRWLRGSVFLLKPFVTDN